MKSVDSSIFFKPSAKWSAVATLLVAAGFLYIEQVGKQEFRNELANGKKVEIRVVKPGQQR